MLQQSTRNIEKYQHVGNELVDAHCHLELFKDPQTTISDSVMGGVRLIITAGGSRTSSIAAMDLADGKNVFAVIGIDPAYALKDGDFLGEIEDIVKANKGVVGIGEVGLDYKIDVPKDVQKEVFEDQIEIARSLGIPLVIHSRQAIDDVMAVVREHKVRGAMFHYFEGDEKQALELADMGCFISIPPVESSKRKRVINSLDISNLVVETDSPVVGKTPLDVIKAVEWIAQIKGMGFDETAHRLTQNVKKVFSL